MNMYMYIKFFLNIRTHGIVISNVIITALNRRSSFVILLLFLLLLFFEVTLS